VAPDGEGPSERPIRVRSALILEDNVTIAFDLEAMLHGLGVDDVAVAATLEEACAEVARRSFDVYLLDINLGDTTSIPLAEELVGAGKLVIFTTGYGDHAMLPAAMRDVPILDKPYLDTTLAERLSAIA
jgi:DNA-binding NtrC family response regulator